MTPGSRICTYFGTRVGCPYGSNCRFTHPGPEPGRSVLHDLSEPLAVIESLSQTRQQYDALDATIARRESIASFSWTTEDNVIVVPGIGSQRVLRYKRSLRTT